MRSMINAALAASLLSGLSGSLPADTPPKTIEETKTLLTAHPWYVSGNCTADESDWDSFNKTPFEGNDGLYEQRHSVPGSDDRRPNGLAGWYKVVDPAHVRIMDEKTGKKPIAEMMVSVAGDGTLRITLKGVSTAFARDLKECLAQLPSALDPATVPHTPYVRALKQCLSAPLHKFGALTKSGTNMEANIVVARPDGFRSETAIFEQRPDGKMHFTEVYNRFGKQGFEAHEVCDVDTGVEARLKRDKDDLEGAPTGPFTTASSELKAQSGNKYDATQIFDGNIGTAWVEGKPGPGLGEWIEIGFLGEKLVSSVKIFPGYGKSEVAFKNNNRPKTIRLQFSTGATQEISLEDGMKWQTFQVIPAVRTSSVRLIIVDVYHGGKSDDTAISEVQFP
jgi:hypothetical protein